MPQQCTLVARPVILSENKRNVIPHGRPLTPIGTVRSTRPFFVPRQVKDSFTEEKHGDTISLKAAPSVTSSTSLMDYHKSANENLMTINNNLSLMLKESFAGIDSICQKVRLCLLEANTIKPPENLETLIRESQETLPVKNLGTHIDEDLEDRTVKNLEIRIVENRRESFQILSTCEEEAESRMSIDDVPDITDDLDENEAEIVEEREEEDEEKGNQMEELEEKPKRTPSITPFFTILNPRTESLEVNIIKSISSKLGLSRKCTAESFHNTMREVEKLSDYEEFLTSMVEGINREIDECYAKYPKCEGKTKRDKDKNGPKDAKKGNDKKNSSRVSLSKSKKSRGASAISEELRSLHKAHKIQRDLMEDQFSENDLTCRDSLGSRRRLGLSIISGRMDFTCPDVYRKRAITDLHKRLEAQVEANDSLIFFQKLMAKNKKHMTEQRPFTSVCNSGERSTDSNLFKSPMQYLLPAKRQQEERRQRSLLDLSKKYQDSLWFKQKKCESKRSKKEAVFLKKKKDKRGKKEKNILPQSYTIESSASEGHKTKTNKICLKSPSQASICKCQIKITNDQPLSDAHKCKLHWMRAKYSQLRQKKLKYLDILDDISKNDLLPIKAEYPRRDEIKTTGVKNSYLYKLMYGQNRETQNAWDQLFQPSTKCSQENCRKCSPTTMSHKQDSSDKHIEQNLRNNVFPGKLEPNTDYREKGDVIRKLSKYIFFDEVRPKSSKRIFTVMPVHVFYDNSRISPNNRRNAEVPSKLPLVPMKETKELVKKAEWNDAAKKAKPARIVYDPILRKIEREIRLVNAKPESNTAPSKLGQTNSWSPKNFSQYCSPTRHSADSGTLSFKMDAVDRAPQKQKYLSSSNARSPPIAELFKRSAKPHQVSVPPLWDTPALERHQKDLEVKQKIKKTVTTEASARIKNEQQRKIWEHKYGKTVGQKLVNFIEKQPSQYQIPVPKYALPKGVNTTRHQVMLEQLRTLKEKNDSIQTNIQKAIQVIENKMVDILSKPTTSESIEAFDEMEKEITSVLSLMKIPSLPKSVSKKEKIGKIDDYGTDISDELFQRLDRILESPGMSSSSKSSKNNLKKEEKHKRKHKTHGNLPPKSTDMNQLCFSSTSATGEEKFTITAISPKRAYKSPTRAPYIKNPLDAGPTDPEDVSTISNELRKLENELKFKHSPEDVNRPNAEPDENDSEPIREPTPLRKSSILIKQRKSITTQEQVVNLALFHPNDQAGSAGDQLQELKKILEDELKSLDGSDDKTPSIGVSHSFSQGDYEVSNVAKKNSVEKVSESTEMDADSALEEKVPSVQKSTETNPPIQEETAEKASVETKPEQPTEILVSYQEATAVQKQQVSQLSLDITGPYLTPLTSPLSKTRPQLLCRPIVEEEKQCCHNEECETLKPDEGDEQRCEKENDREDCQNKNGKEQQEQVKTANDLKHDGLEEEQVTHSRSTDEDGKCATSGKDDFYENVNKIISRVENVYNQLEEFEEEMLQEEQKLQSTSLTGRMALFQDDPPETPPVPDHDTDVFLTPFMHAVKDLRKSVGEITPETQSSSPRMNRSPSLYNVLSFLDNLADFKREQVIEVYTPRDCYFSYVVHIPQTFHQYNIYQQTSFTDPADLLPPPPPPLSEVPKKKSGCLKNPVSSTVSTVASKSKQKVSFLLQKEEKSTQVTSCPFHSVARILSQQKIGASADLSGSFKRDEQVSAYLDALENKSVDRMSTPDEESTYQSTFEFSDEYSLDKNFQMPDRIAQNIQETFDKKGSDVTNAKKNVVEIFRNNNDNRPEGIKVFSAKRDLGEVERVPERYDQRGVKVFSEEPTREAAVSIAEEVSGKSSVKVFYDDFKSGQDKLNLKLICGFYNEESILQVKNSLGKDVDVKKRDSLEKLIKNLGEQPLSVGLFREPSLFEPLTNLDRFVDSKLLKEAVEKRQAIRMMRRKSSQSVTMTSKRDSTNTRTVKTVRVAEQGEKENLLKGFYVFVYLLMFTALNLEYKCVQ